METDGFLTEEDEVQLHRTIAEFQLHWLGAMYLAIILGIAHISTTIWTIPLVSKNLFAVPFYVSANTETWQIFSFVPGCMLIVIGVVIAAKIRIEYHPYILSIAGKKPALAFAPRWVQYTVIFLLFLCVAGFASMIMSAGK